jgi:hypothetical protein
MSRTTPVSLISGILCLGGMLMFAPESFTQDATGEVLVTKHYATESLIHPLLTRLIARHLERHHIDESQQPRCVLPVTVLMEEGIDLDSRNFVSHPWYWTMTAPEKEHAKFQKLCVQFTGAPAHVLSDAELNKIDDEVAAAQKKMDTDPNNPFRKRP